jgi:AcrR family transcriptional regulator
MIQPGSLRRGSDLKSRILKVSIRRVRARGPAGLTMRTVAGDLGVTAGALYLYYASRNAILADIPAYGFAETARRLKRPIPDRDPTTRVLVLLSRYIEFALDDCEIFDLMFANQPPGHSWPGHAGSSGVSRIVEILKAEVLNAMRSGAWRESDVSAVSLAVWAHAHGLADLYRAGRITESRRDAMEAAVNAMTVLLRGLQDVSTEVRAQAERSLH